MENKYILHTEGLSKKFKDKQVISDVNIRLRKGDIYGLLGLNGAGKTTTLKLILGFLKPTNGKIYLNDRQMHINRGEEKAFIGAMIEAPAFYDNLTGRKNLQIIAELYGEDAVKRVDEVLELVEMEHAADKKVSEYSMGMKQRLGIGRAFLNNPDLVILDEPTNGLDPYGMKSIRELIVKLTKNHNKTFLISTHLLHEAELICNRVGIIHNGQLIEEFDKEEMQLVKSKGGSLEDTFISLTEEERRYA